MPPAGRQQKLKEQWILRKKSFQAGRPTVKQIKGLNVFILCLFDKCSICQQQVFSRLSDPFELICNKTDVRKSDAGSNSVLQPGAGLTSQLKSSHFVVPPVLYNERKAEPWTCSSVNKGIDSETQVSSRLCYWNMSNPPPNMFETVVPGGLAAVALAGVPGVQPPQSVLGLLADAGSAQHGVQRPAVGWHVLGHLWVGVGELHELYCCWNLRTEEVKGFIPTGGK